jgi:hypothetical protein
MGSLNCGVRTDCNPAHAPQADSAGKVALVFRRRFVARGGGNWDRAGGGAGSTGNARESLALAGFPLTGGRGRHTDFCAFCFDGQSKIEIVCSGEARRYFWRHSLMSKSFTHS